jgi:hypothetical protein
MNVIKIVLMMGFIAALSMGLEIGPEKFVSANPARVQVKSQAAFGGGQYLAVWQENEMHSSTIYGTRVSGAGIILDTQGIAISIKAHYQHEPSVAYSDSLFLVVWSDMQNGRDYDVYGARVNASGIVLDTQGLLIAGGVDNQCRPHLTDIPGGFMVVWEQYVGQGYVPCAVRVGLDGKLLDAQPTRLVNPGVSKEPIDLSGWGDLVPCERPRIARIDTVLFVSWIGAVNRWLWGQFAPCGALLSIRGGLLAPSRMVYNSGRCFSDDITVHKNNFFVMWENRNGRGEAQPHNAVFIDAGGQNTKDTIAFSTKNVLEPAVASLGDNLYALHMLRHDARYGSLNELVLRRMVLGTRNALDSAVISPWAASPALVSDGSRNMLALYTKLPDAGNPTVRLVCRLLTDTGISTSSEVAAGRSAVNLLSAFPNPFNGRTTISYRLSDIGAEMKLDIVGIDGKIVRTFGANPVAGTHQLVWDGHDAYGNSVAQGMYYCRLYGGTIDIRKKILIIK